MGVLPFVYLGAGMAVGWQAGSPVFLRFCDKLSTVALFLLLLAIGAGIGADENVMGRLGTIGVHCVLLVLSAILGSVLLTVLCEKTVLPLKSIEEKLQVESAGADTGIKTAGTETAGADDTAGSVANSETRTAGAGEAEENGTDGAKTGGAVDTAGSVANSETRTAGPVKAGENGTDRAKTGGAATDTAASIPAATAGIDTAGSIKAGGTTTDAATDTGAAGTGESVSGSAGGTKKRGIPFIWLMPLSILTGLALGYLLQDTLPEALTDGVFNLSLAILYISVGISQGANREVFTYLKRLGPRVIFLPLSILAGSLCGGFLAGLLAHIPLRLSLLATCGMGYYSLTGAFMTQSLGLEAGAYGFLVNVMRDFFTVLLMPLLVRVSLGSPIASGASGCMDTMLAPVTKYAGVNLGLVALLTGTLLTFAVPFLLPVLGWALGV